MKVFLCMMLAVGALCLTACGGSKSTSTVTIKTTEAPQSRLSNADWTGFAPLVQEDEKLQRQAARQGGTLQEKAAFECRLLAQYATKHRLNDPAARGFVKFCPAVNEYAVAILDKLPQCTNPHCVAVTLQRANKALRRSIRLTKNIIRNLGLRPGACTDYFLVDKISALADQIDILTGAAIRNDRAAYEQAIKPFQAQLQAISKERKNFVYFKRNCQPAQSTGE